MDHHRELIRPSRSKHRSNAVAAMRLLERREKVAQLEHELTGAQARLEEEEAFTAELEQLEAMKQRLITDELQIQIKRQENKKIRDEAHCALQQDEKESRELNEQQHFQYLQMEALEGELTTLASRLEFLQNYQSTLADVEGFDHVIGKFQELNQTWQQMADECRALQNQIHEITGTRLVTEAGMQQLREANDADARREGRSNFATTRNKTSRNSQWHIISVTESFKQHGHMYLAILNLAAHLSAHPLSRTLTNIDSTSGRTAKHCPTKKAEKAPSIEQIPQQPISTQSYREKWKSLAALAIGGDGKLQARAGDISFSSEFGRTPESVSMEVQQKFTTMVGLDDTSKAPKTVKQAMINKVASVKLNFIEQIIYDLTLIKEEIEYQTDPIHYNEPGYSFA